LRCYDIIGEFLQSRAQPSLGLPLFLALALIRLPNPGHFRNERLDDPVDFLPDEHEESSHWFTVSIRCDGSWFTTDPPRRPRPAPSVAVHSRGVSEMRTANEGAAQ
jgi:hypothetical protein